jgi:stress-induced morphogen
MPAEKEIIFNVLNSNFPDCELNMVDLAGDKDHWQISIKHNSLLGKTRIEQHREIMKYLEPLNIHAVSIKVVS